MADLTKAKWELTKNDTCAIAWFEKNGFEVTLKKQYISKTVYSVKKGIVEDTFELPNGFNYDCESYMEQYRKQFEQLCLIKAKEIGAKICPKCGKTYTVRPAISRNDNRTEICPICGTREALDATTMSEAEKAEIIGFIEIFEKDRR